MEQRRSRSPMSRKSKNQTNNCPLLKSRKEEAPKYAYRRRTRRQYRSRSRGRRRHYSSSSSEETNESVERPRIKPEIKYVHPKKHEKDRETVREQNSEKYDEVQQNSKEGDVEFQGSGPSGCLENRESRKDNNATEMRLKSADYDDIRRDYI
ncbi:hypothetical protein JTB14_020331 [Gonioctena quinquepunctata]|nr:hypothetical protein JTB14_020331 [Gonioctena quinquepunctata]